MLRLIIVVFSVMGAWLLMAGTTIPATEHLFVDRVGLIWGFVIVGFVALLELDKYVINWIRGRDISYRPRESSDLIGRDVKKY